MSDDIIVALIGAFAVIVTAIITGIVNIVVSIQKNYRHSRSSKKR